MNGFGLPFFFFRSKDSLTGARGGSAEKSARLFQRVLGLLTPWWHVCMYMLFVRPR